MSIFPSVGTQILTGLGGQGLQLFDRGLSRVTSTLDREREYQERRLAEARAEKRRREAEKRARTNQLANIGIGVGAGALTGGFLAAGAPAATAPATTALTEAGNLSGGTIGAEVVKAAPEAIAEGIEPAGELATIGDFAGEPIADTKGLFTGATRVDETLKSVPPDLSPSSTNVPASELNPGLTGIDKVSNRTVSTPAPFSSATDNVADNSIFRGVLLGGLTGGLASSGVPGLVNVAQTVQAASPIFNPNLAIQNERLRLAREDNAADRNYRDARLNLDRDRLGLQREDAISGRNYRDANLELNRSNAANLKDYRDRQLELETDPTTPANVARAAAADASRSVAAKNNAAASPINRFFGGVKDTLDKGVKEIGDFSTSPIGQLAVAANLAGVPIQEAARGYVDTKTGNRDRVVGETMGLVNELEKRINASQQSGEEDNYIPILASRLDQLAKATPEKIDPRTAATLMTSLGFRRLSPEAQQAVTSITENAALNTLNPSSSPTLEAVTKRRTSGVPGQFDKVMDEVLNADSAATASAIIENAFKEGRITDREREDLIAANGG